MVIKLALLGCYILFIIAWSFRTGDKAGIHINAGAESTPTPIIRLVPIEIPVSSPVYIYLTPTPDHSSTPEPTLEPRLEPSPTPAPTPPVAIPTTPKPTIADIEVEKTPEPTAEPTTVPTPTPTIPHPTALPTPCHAQHKGWCINKLFGR